MSARQCLKRLHLEIHRPDLASISRATEAAFATGHKVGDIAQRIFGSDDSVFIPYEGGLGHALKKTARIMNGSVKIPIFEATFQYGGVLVRIDALLPQEDSWRIVEVKASTSVKDEHMFDCAIQRWVFEGLGHKLHSISLAHVDNSFVYAGDGNFVGLLAEVDVTAESAALAAVVPEWIDSARNAAGEQLPQIAVGAHCSKPYECPFTAHCWPSEPEYPVQGLGGSKARLGKFVALGYTDIRDVPADSLSEKQLRIQRITRSGDAELLPAARDFVDSLPYPRYYLDFETIMPAVPLWRDTRPYETLPFQWSCHYESDPGQIEHADFLDLSGEPPMRRLAESLLRVVGNAGPVLTYTDYEKRVIGALRDRFPDLAGALAALIDRLVDLKPVTEQNFYHPAMAGSWSLKALVPVIAADLDYQNLEGIQEGTAASEGYLEAVSADVSEARKEALEVQLRRYCRFDTEAMVRLVHFLGSAAEPCA
jgi:hypothetical protein